LRFQLRKPQNPPSQFPLRLRASSLAQSYWCDHQTRIRILEQNEANTTDDTSEETDATAKGTIMHKVLEESQGRRFPHELELMHKLESYNDEVLGFTRKIDDTTIYADITAHPDDIQVLPSRRVAFIEYKTTHVNHVKDNTPEQDNIAAYDFISRWKAPMAKFQSCVYSWVFEPILYDLGYCLDDKNAIVYYNSDTFAQLGPSIIADYNQYATLSQIQRIMSYLQDETLCIDPHPFKCRFCMKIVRCKCSVWLKNNPDKHYGEI
jgi:hypothetical protein